MKQALQSITFIVLLLLCHSHGCLLRRGTLVHGDELIGVLLLDLLPSTVSQTISASKSNCSFPLHTYWLLWCCGGGPIDDVLLNCLVLIRPVVYTSSVRGHAIGCKLTTKNSTFHASQEFWEVQSPASVKFGMGVFCDGRYLFLPGTAAYTLRGTLTT